MWHPIVVLGFTSAHSLSNFYSDISQEALDGLTLQSNITFAKKELVAFQICSANDRVDYFFGGYHQPVICLLQYIVEQGSHQQLLDAKGFIHKLYMSQCIGFAIQTLVIRYFLH
jgi:hypothetical protein